jgi:hypothetical protein
VPLLLEDLLHPPRLVVADLEIGVGHPGQDEGESGEIAGALRRQGLQLTDDLAHRLGVPTVVARAAPQAQKIQKRHRADPTTEARNLRGLEIW